jgi:hypothetical protein
MAATGFGKIEDNAAENRAKLGVHHPSVAAMSVGA